FIVVLSEGGPKPIDRTWRIGKPRTHVRHSDLADPRVFDQLDVLSCLEVRVFEYFGYRIDRSIGDIKTVAKFHEFFERVLFGPACNPGVDFGSMAHPVLDLSPLALRREVGLPQQLRQTRENLVRSTRDRNPLV